MHSTQPGPVSLLVDASRSKVGKYKSKLEAQGWAYEMQVSFLEIYNEQIRDLLRENDGSKVCLRCQKKISILRLFSRLDRCPLAALKLEQTYG